MFGDDGYCDLNIVLLHVEAGARHRVGGLGASVVGYYFEGRDHHDRFFLWLRSIFSGLFGPGSDLGVELIGGGVICDGKFQALPSLLMCKLRPDCEKIPVLVN